MKGLINTNLISLKCIVFLFLTGVGCLYPFLTPHARSIELSLYSVCIISVVAPLFSILGPLIAGVLADRWSSSSATEANNAGGNDANQAGSRVIRLMLAGCLILTALFYGLLLAVPSVKHLELRRPSVSFMCDSQGGMIYQEMCTEEKICNRWEGEKFGMLILSNCTYACEKPPNLSDFIYMDSSSTTEIPPSNTNDSDDDVNSDGVVENEAEFNPDEDDTYARDESVEVEQKRKISPHLCYRASDSGPPTCHAYLKYAKHINISSTSLLKASEEEDNGTSWCKYPLGGEFKCNVPQHEVDLLSQKLVENATCKPVIECKIKDPYDSKSVLAESQCMQYIGDPVTSFWIYIVFRSLGDMFATATLCLICTACVIATRETSLGRGDVGRQLAFGIIGMAIIPPLVGCIQDQVSVDDVGYLIPFIFAIVFFVMAALVSIFDKNMPLSPPELWWHTKSGMLALPMNTIRKYNWEVIGVVFVLVILGIFWSALDTYMSLVIYELKGNNLLLSLTMTIGGLPAIPVLWKAERVVDYCGHSNIFIGAFTFYIIRYTGMAIMDDPWWVLLCEVFEVFTLSLMWVTAILYFRHLFSKKHTATGQGLAVAAHFCFGRFIGALIGSLISNGDVIDIYQITCKDMAIAACVLGIVYLLLYHIVLAPLCRATTTSPPNQLVMQGLNNSNGTTNGSYTPLRVYHNERARKGQFRY